MVAILTLFLAIIFITNDRNETDHFRCGIDKVNDIDENSYNTVQIGERCWMADNLKTTTFKDGVDIPRPESNTSWREAGNNKIGAYACYGNRNENCEIYGGLYNVYAVAEGICPEGWYVPLDDDWKELERYMGMSDEEVDLLYWRGSNLATALSGEPDLWTDPKIGTRKDLNSSGFSAIPAGYRLSNGIYSWIGQRANFWTSTIDASGWRRTIMPESSESVRRTAAAKNMGFSVRCIMKDVSR